MNRPYGSPLPTPKLAGGSKKEILRLTLRLRDRFLPLRMTDKPSPAGEGLGTPHPSCYASHLPLYGKALFDHEEGGFEDGCCGIDGNLTVFVNREVALRIASVGVDF